MTPGSALRAWGQARAAAGAVDTEPGARLSYRSVDLRVMPRHVDHDERRAEIIGAVMRLAARRGLQGIRFREVAAEAGMSVSQIQHYFGTKANLMAATIHACSTDMGQRAVRQLELLGPDPDPLRRIDCIAKAFLPTDEASRSAMLVILGFAATALVDTSMLSDEAFRDETNLRKLVTAELEEARRRDLVRDDLDPTVEARAINSMIIGLSVALLLGSCDADEARTVIGSHIALISSK